MNDPVGTYRIQFTPSFDFKSAKDIISYLAELGISHIYASPIFKPRKGSRHGYDVVNPKRLNPELGTREDFEELIEDLEIHGLKWIQDFTPNHMAYDYKNRMLRDVLENGQSSQYFDFFDIEWDHPCRKIRGKLLAPFLEKGYKETLEEGSIRLNYRESGLTVEYHELKFPLKMESYTEVLSSISDKLKGKLRTSHSDYRSFLETLHVLGNLSSKPAERDNQVNFVKDTLWELYTKNEEFKSLLDRRIEVLNGEKGKTGSFNFLKELLSEQLFVLSFWKIANKKINYRRFFTVNFLICLRMEENNVFQHVHSLLFKLIEQGKIDGLRIDHIDGLYDPTKYLKKLREIADEEYIVVEKILDLNEKLPHFWPVQGTTGYKFLNYVNGSFCVQENEEEFNQIYSRFSGIKKPYKDLLYEKKKLIMDRYMTGDLNNLTRLMHRILKSGKHGKEITFQKLKRGLREVMALLPVYRTYITKERFPPDDKQILRQTLKEARHKKQKLTHTLHFIEKVLLLESEERTRGKKEQQLQFIRRWQQFTGPIMAKGLEDTTLYIYNRLLSLNEVGGKPNKFGIPLQEFHDFNKKRANPDSQSLNTTSTHDTKRGEDVRARINVLSEIPREWENKIETWNRLNHKKKKTVNGEKVPDKNEEYLIYQTLLGAFPFNFKGNNAEFTERIKRYLVKSLREAKIHSSWLEPDKEYEKASTSFVEDILNPSVKNQFLKDFLSFQRKVVHYGILNSLSQTIIKITSPGTPDFYQGTEIWDLNLVDPDNRRPVNFEKRKRMLQDIKSKVEKGTSSLIEELLSNPEGGKVKLFLILMTLKTRGENPQLFQKGSYIPLEGQGKFKEHIISFARVYREKWIVTVAPRFLTDLIDKGEFPLGQVWEDTEIPLPENSPSFWENTITGEKIKSKKALPVKETLQKFPVALIINRRPKK